MYYIRTSSRVCRLMTLESMALNLLMCPKTHLCSFCLCSPLRQTSKPLIIKRALSCWQCLVISLISRPAVCLSSQRTTPSTSRCPSMTCRRGWAALQSLSTTAPTPGSSSSPSSSLLCRGSKSWRWVESPHKTPQNVFTSQLLREPAM